MSQHHILSYGTCEELSVQHIDGLVVPGILTLQVNSVQKVLYEGRQHHGEQDGILRGTERGDISLNTFVPLLCVCVLASVICCNHVGTSVQV